MYTSPRFAIPMENGQVDMTKVQDIFVQNADGDVDFGDLAARNLWIEQRFAPYAEALAVRGFSVSPEQSDRECDLAIVFLGRFREVNQAMIARAYRLLRKGQMLIVDGQKTDGVDSTIRAMKSAGLSLLSEPKSHGKVAWVEKAYEPPVFPLWEKQIAPFTNKDGYVANAGVFSSKEVDKGTKFLLENLPAKLKGQVVEFGAGYGAIARPVLAQYEAVEAYTLYEADYDAHLLSKKNVEDKRAIFQWSDVMDIEGGEYDWVITNPPFHVGRAGDPEIGASFIRAAARALKYNGQLLMVANRHLPYEKTVEDNFRVSKIVAQNNAYKVIHAIKPKRV